MGRKKYDLNRQVFDSAGERQGQLNESLAGSLGRTLTDDELIIMKIDTFVEELKTGTIELDDADYQVFKKLVLKSDLFQFAKSAALRTLKMTSKNESD